VAVITSTEYAGATAKTPFRGARSRMRPGIFRPCGRETTSPTIRPRGREAAIRGAGGAGSKTPLLHTRHLRGATGFTGVKSHANACNCEGGQIEGQFQDYRRYPPGAILVLEAGGMGPRELGQPKRLASAPKLINIGCGGACSHAQRTGGAPPPSRPGLGIGLSAFHPTPGRTRRTISLQWGVFPPRTPG